MLSDVVTATLDVLRLAARDAESDLDELLQPLIDELGWTAVCDGVFKALESNETTIWYTAAAAIWGAALDKRDMDANRAIALAYFRLNPNKDEEENLAWSIACKLKAVDYLSGYDPRLDPPITEHLEQLRSR